jgi:hypothetical protein
MHRRCSVIATDNRRLQLMDRQTTVAALAAWRLGPEDQSKPENLSMHGATTVFICNTVAKAGEARQFLLANGYEDGDITNEEVAAFTYDAARYWGGPVHTASGTILVIGRK